MSKYDLSFVEPERRPEILRRIEVIESFMRDRGRESAVRHAGLLGLRPAQFYVLVRAWATTGRPEAIAGSGQPKVRRLEISAEQAEVMDAVIAAAPRTPPRQMVKRIDEVARERGTAMPGIETITRYVARSRPRLLPPEISAVPALVVDHSVLDLSVAFGSGVPSRPLATFVIDTREEAVVGLALSDGPPSPAATAAALLNAVNRARRAQQPLAPTRVHVTLPVEPGAHWSVFQADLTAARVEVSYRAVGKYGHGAMAESILGRRPGGIRLRPRLVSLDLGKRQGSPVGRAAPMSPQEAFDYSHPRLVGSRSTALFSGHSDMDQRILHEVLTSWSGG